MKILYATDGGEPAVAAATVIERFFDPTRVSLTVLTVTQTGMPNPESMPYMLDDLDERRENSLKIVDQTATRMQTAGFTTDGRMLEGNAAREIVRLAEDGWYDLTIVGGTGRTWLGNHLLGSVSTYVLHHSPSSVLVVHDPPKEGHDSILVGVDGSHPATRAVNDLCLFAVPGRHIKALSIASLVPVPSGVSMVPMPHVDTPRRQEGQRKNVDRAWQIAEGAADTLREHGFKAEADATAGHPTTELLKELERGSYGMAVVGCRGLSAIRRTILGSVSDGIARHAPAAYVSRRSFE